MSEDPETARQINEVADDSRPLLIVDVDEVILEFVTPLIAYFSSQGLEFRTESFRLHGNVFDKASGLPASAESVSARLDAFFAEQDIWQTPTEGAVQALKMLSEQAQVVLLTAMPHSYHAKRRRLLDRFGIGYPLITTEKSKGPAAKMLFGERKAPVAFVDDIPHNLFSVGEALPQTNLFHLMSNQSIRKHLPSLPANVTAAESWSDASEKISQVLSD